MNWNEVAYLILDHFRGRAAQAKQNSKTFQNSLFTHHHHIQKFTYMKIATVAQYSLLILPFTQKGLFSQNIESTFKGRSIKLCIWLNDWLTGRNFVGGSDACKQVFLCVYMNAIKILFATHHHFPRLFCSVAVSCLVTMYFVYCCKYSIYTHLFCAKWQVLISPHVNA